MNTVLIKNANIVNEGKIFKGDVLIEGDRIAEISESISAKSANTKIINADGKYLMPGMIDDQVHFREPGLTRSEERRVGKEGSSRWSTASHKKPGRETNRPITKA